MGDDEQQGGHQPRQSYPVSLVEEALENVQRRKARRWVVVLVLASSLCAVIYRLLMHRELQFAHSGLMFIGIPTVLAILLSFSPRAETATGGIVFGITVVLLVVAPLLGEGYLCILFAAPLFYLVGVFVGLIVDWTRRGTKRDRTLRCVAVVLLPICLEGVVPWLTHERGQTVEVTRIVNAPAVAVEASLSAGLRVRAPLPRFLRIGFPRPLWASGTGLALGDERRIHFSGAEGDPEGDLVMRVAERGPGYARFERVSDASKLTQWIAWDSSDVEWRAVDARHTQVTWRVRFERQLDPYWYFAPWERLAMHEAAGYLIEADATPATGAQ